MTTVIFVVSVAAAIAIGTVGAYWLMLKVMTTKRGKAAIKDYTKELGDLTYELIKSSMADTKKWTELFTGVED